MTARFIIGDALTVLRSMSGASVQSVITSPPYYRQREYLPSDHPAKAAEIGHEPRPHDFLEALLVVMDELWRVMSADATFWVNLGDKHAGSGGAGGDYNEGGLRDGQPRFDRFASSVDTPRDQSVCWLPELFGASLAYGRNLLTGQPHRQWVTRPPVTWCKPAPPVGSTGRKFRSATELIIYGGKHEAHYFDLDSVREPAPPENERKTWNQTGPKQRLATDRSDGVMGRARFTQRTVNSNGKPPLNFWVVHTEGYPGAHFATFPPQLITRPVVVGCPAGGTILDPFAGSGTTLAVATGHGRDAIGVDLDARNADLARERVGMFLEVEHFAATEAPA